MSYKDLNVYYQKIIQNLDKNFNTRINEELDDSQVKILTKNKIEDFKKKKASQSLSYCFNKVIRYYKRNYNAKNIKIYYEHTLTNFDIDKNNNQIKARM